MSYSGRRLALVVERVWMEEHSKIFYDIGKKNLRILVAGVNVEELKPTTFIYFGNAPLLYLMGRN